MLALTYEPPMTEKRKVGRPSTGRNDVTVRINFKVKANAEIVAKRRGINLNEYLTNILAPIVLKDLDKEMKLVDKEAKQV